MELCDVNVWLALTLSAHVHHRAAKRWLEGIAEPESVCFCRATQQALLRLLSNPAVLGPYGNHALTNAEAWAVLDAFLEDDRIVARSQEPPGVEPQWRRYAVRDSASPKLWMNAYLAAFARAGGDRIVTTDTAFRQFAELDVLVLP
ncbi:MAG: PIN domain-containing protein [Solirubrobacterales bacterium]|nr:PIN domain-containing protein [Solirubrobacterales bacterium]